MRSGSVELTAAVETSGNDRGSATRPGIKADKVALHQVDQVLRNGLEAGPSSVSNPAHEGVSVLSCSALPNAQETIVGPGARWRLLASPGDSNPVG